MVLVNQRVKSSKKSKLKPKPKPKAKAKDGRRVAGPSRSNPAQVAQDASAQRALQLVSSLASPLAQHGDPEQDGSPNVRRCWSFDVEQSTEHTASGRIITATSPSSPLILHLAHSSALTLNEKECIFSLFESNMRSSYEANANARDRDGNHAGPGGWDPEEKKGELFDDEARFLLVYPVECQQGETEEKAAAADQRELLGFATFRFTVEPLHPSDPLNTQVVKRWRKIEVLYLYELQLSPALRGCGIGSALMDLLVCLARATHMRKLCLTVFKDNVGAKRFYERQGWSRDRISPGEEEGERWEILSRVV